MGQVRAYSKFISVRDDFNIFRVANSVTRKRSTIKKTEMHPDARELIQNTVSLS